MPDENAQPGASSEAPQFNPQEQASIEVGQRGYSEPANVNVPVDNSPQRPDYIPEKFWKDGKADLEGLAKSYAELERARSVPQQEAPKAPEVPAVTPAADGKIVKPEAPKAPEANPLTDAMEAARTEFAETQAVSDETVAKLEAAGIPKEVFNLYLEGVKAVTKQATEAIHGYVDGEANYAAMTDWAAKTLSDEELDAYNSALDNPQLRENAVRGLYARFQTARPSEGTLITPAGTPSQAGDVYSDRSQLIADQKDPRYQTDAAFRQSVVEKLQRSQNAGFQLVQRPMFERQVYST